MKNKNYIELLESLSLLDIDINDDTELLNALCVFLVYKKDNANFKQNFHKYSIDKIDTKGSEKKKAFKYITETLWLKQEYDDWINIIFEEAILPIVLDKPVFITSTKLKFEKILITNCFLKYKEKIRSADNVYKLDLNGAMSTDKSWYPPFLNTFSESEIVLFWNAIFYYNSKHSPVKSDGHIKKVIDTYRNLKIPLIVALTHFKDIKEYPTCRNAINPWQYVVKGIKKMPIESGMRVDEDAFNIAVENIADKKPSIIIKSFFYTSDRNDSGFDCEYLYNELFIDSSKSEKILVVNPSPHFIEKLEKDKIRNVTYVVTDKTVAALYSMEFSNNEFIALGDKSIDKIKYDKLLITTHDNKSYDVFYQYLSLCSENGVILAVLPHKLMSKENKTKFCKNIEENRLIIDSILILNSSLTKSAPTKKVLIKFEKYSSLDLGQEYSFIIRHFKCLSKDIHEIMKKSTVICYDSFMKTKKSLTTIINEGGTNTKNNNGVKRRKAARSYVFSNEITIAYTLEDKQGGNKPAKAYYNKLIKNNRDIIVEGKKATKVISKGLSFRSETELPKLLELVPFDERLISIITNNILDIYKDKMNEVSLKTVWFCLRKKLILCDKYNEELSRQMFCSSHKSLEQLPLNALKENFVSIMEDEFKNNTKNEQMKYWLQLNQLLECAINNGYIFENQIKDKIRDVICKINKAHQEVRNALAKKTFTINEEIRIFEYITKSIEIKGEKYIRSDIDNVCVALAIRFFTGMSMREICALKWSDLVKIPNLDAYQLQVGKILKQDGSINRKPNKSELKKFRCVPISELLQKILLRRKAYIEDKELKLSKDSKTIEDIPIILSIKSKKREWFKRLPNYKQLSSSTKKIITDTIIEKELLLTLPDGEDEIITDIMKYKGDIFASNFKFRLYNICGMNKGELHYIMGVEPPNTFARNYCDYNNDLVQYAMCKKLDRWGSVFVKSKVQPKLVSKIKKKNTIRFMGSEGTVGNIVVSLIPMKNDVSKKTNIIVSSENGLTGCIMLDRKEKKVNDKII